MNNTAKLIALVFIIFGTSIALWGWRGFFIGLVILGVEAFIEDWWKNRKKEEENEN